MHASLHLRCAFCGVLFPLAADAAGARHDDPPLFCAAPLAPACYACAAPAAAPRFSATQLARAAAGEPAFCAACIAARARARFVPPPPPPTLDAQLEAAVGDLDAPLVRALLAAGADANRVRQAGLLVRGQWQPLFLASGAPAPEEGGEIEQPTTPLRLVAFRAADCMLSEEAARGAAEIARELIRAGADARDAAGYCARRYGEFEEGGSGAIFEVYAATLAGAR